MTRPWWWTSVVFVLVATPAQAQLCRGGPSFTGYPYQVGAMAAVTDGAQAYGGDFGVGGRYLFAGAGFSGRHVEEADSSAAEVSSRVGLEFRVSETRRIFFFEVPSVMTPMIDWTSLGRSARALAGTPCFLFSERRVHTALTAQRGLESSLPLRHWLSLKTQPIRQLVETCRDWDIGLEVVSEFELVAVLASDVPKGAILVNGVGKHHWLPRYPVAGLTLHFDSLAEVRALAGMARALAWRVGVRCAVPQSTDEITPVWDQFGLVAEEVPVAAAMLKDTGVPVRGLHVHLHQRRARLRVPAGARASPASLCAGVSGGRPSSRVRSIPPSWPMRSARCRTGPTVRSLRTGAVRVGVGGDPDVRAVRGRPIRPVHGGVQPVPPRGDRPAAPRRLDELCESWRR